MVVYKHIPQRVLDHPLLAKILPLTWRKKLAHYLEHNMGGIAGNFFLGVFLGSIGTIGFLIGLPIDIRHITFAAGNFGLAVVGLEHNLSLMQIAMTSIGIVGIGIMNFVVSFGLALYVALRARNVHFYQTRELLIAIGKKFVKSPLDFIRPPKSN
jgi:site-specific recombinase